VRGYEARQLQNCIDVFSCCVDISALHTNLRNEILARTVERDVPGSRAAIIRNMTTYFPDAICGFSQSQGLVVAEVWYEELVAGRVWDHLVRVRRKLSILVWTGTAERKLRRGWRNIGR
jgi:hypothetical protein